MQQELVIPTNAIGSAPFLSPDQRLSSPSYLAIGGDFFWPYTLVILVVGGTPIRVTSLPGSTSVSLTPSSVSFDEEGPAATEKHLYLARLTLQYQEIAERYKLSPISRTRSRKLRPSDRITRSSGLPRASSSSA